MQFVETLEASDGIVHHSLVSKFPISGADGRPAFVGGIAIDITDRLQAEKVRAESEERFRQLAETINEVFWMVDVRNVERALHQPGLRTDLGPIVPEPLRAADVFLDAVHPDDVERVRRDAFGQGSRGASTDEEYRIVTPQGSVKWIRNRAFPVKNAEGHVFRMAGIAEDITEKKRAEEALARTPTGARTNFWRRWLTNCAIRWLRSATPSS